MSICSSIFFSLSFICLCSGVQGATFGRAPRAATKYNCLTARRDPHQPGTWALIFPPLRLHLQASPCIWVKLYAERILLQWRRIGHRMRTLLVVPALVDLYEFVFILKRAL